MSERAAFLDRDGTIIEDAEYLADPDRIEFIDGAFDALRMLRAAGYKLVIVTNQSGIARGLYTLVQYRRVEQRMEELLARQGITVDGVFFCPHHPDFSGPCECRKPALGMYRDAERNLGIDLAASVYIGDRLRDVQPALAVGGRGILVKTGVGKVEAARVPDGVDVAEDMLRAAYLITGKTRATPGVFDAGQG
ncbi:MAG: D-glycero-beta-D-manno-heptose 1,7-bisphosphate 7-phosphatase [Gemmatimonadota bacterium]